MDAPSRKRGQRKQKAAAACLIFQYRCSGEPKRISSLQYLPVERFKYLDLASDRRLVKKLRELREWLFILPTLLGRMSRSKYYAVFNGVAGCTPLNHLFFFFFFLQWQAQSRKQAVIEKWPRPKCLDGKREMWQLIMRKGRASTREAHLSLAYDGKFGA